MDRLVHVLALLLILISGGLTAQVPDFDWAQSAGRNDDDQGISIALDASGNSYVTGHFESATIGFGTFTLTNVKAGRPDVYVVKFDSGGDVAWAKSAGGNGFDYSNNIALDVSGNIFVTGAFSDTIRFGATTLTAAGQFDMYIVKYDTSGNLAWAKSAGGPGFEEGYDIAVDASGNSYVAGNFYIRPITLGEITLTNAGEFDMFVVKYDTGGNVLWAKSGGGTGLDYVYGIALDASGNTCVTGHFGGPAITFGTTTLTRVGWYDMYVVKFDTIGNVLWAKNAGGPGGHGVGYGIALDAHGNSYVTGSFDSSNITFDTTTLTGAGGPDIFVVKYDTGGGVVWAKSAGGTLPEYGGGIALDASGNSYVTGWFRSPTITIGSTTLTNAGVDDIYIVKYDTAGNVVWAKSAGGTLSDVATEIAVDSTGNSYVTGYFNSPILAFGSTTLTNATGYWDMFIVKLGNTLSDIASSDAPPARYQLSQNYPNPFNPRTTISYELPSGGNVLLVAYDILGRQVAVLVNGYQDAGQKAVSFDASNLSSGVYTYRLTSGTFSEVGKMILLK